MNEGIHLSTYTVRAYYIPNCIVCSALSLGFIIYILEYFNMVCISEIFVWLYIMKTKSYWLNLCLFSSHNLKSSASYSCSMMSPASQDHFTLHFAILSVWFWSSSLSSCFASWSQVAGHFCCHYSKKLEKQEGKDFPRNLLNTSLYISLARTVSKESNDVEEFFSPSFSFLYFCESNSFLLFLYKNRDIFFM